MKNKLIYFAILLLLFSCNGKGPKEPEETPTSGKIKIMSDESFKLLIDAEINTFQELYPLASITPIYKPEADVFADFLNDSVRCIVVTRKLSLQEEEYFKSKQLIPRATLVAYDAVAFIVNNNNPDSLITFPDIEAIMRGNKLTWSSISDDNKMDTIKVVFDNNKSGSLRYLKEKFKLSGLPNNFYAMDNNDDVISFVENNKDALGIISVNWISDIHDNLSISFLKRVSVVGVSSELHPYANEYYKPYQGFIASKQYPFIRDVYMINKETFHGLGYGFSAFVAGENGQRIILKAGLVPATMPVRLIQPKTEF